VSGNLPTQRTLASAFSSFSQPFQKLTCALKADKDAIALLTQALQSHDREVRARAAFALFMDRGAPSIAIPALTEALSDPDAEVRANAVRAIGAYQDQARPLIPQITALLNDTNNSVRNGAAEALRTINLKLK
jgi:HEAT repeat protein